ncbi:MAG: hypothetical protein JNL98_05525 [Bryobacterales bacterium]|nr:hypothetical protein [Bryobacterales bacterium]
MPWPKLSKSRTSEPAPKPAAPKASAASPAEQRLQKLARKLDAIPAKDAQRIALAQEIERKQHQAAAELYQLCAAFVASLNKVLSEMKVEFSPAGYSSEKLDTPNGSLFQINASGRIIQITLHCKETTASTEHFRVPYILEGRIRSFNQDLLDRQEIHEHQIFYCVDRAGDAWRFFNTRTRTSGRITTDFLIDALEELV